MSSISGVASGRDWRTPESIQFNRETRVDCLLVELSGSRKPVWFPFEQISRPALKSCAKPIQNVGGVTFALTVEHRIQRRKCDARFLFQPVPRPALAL